ncbi:MAG TPA: hypothetical protein VD866_21710 [Urbifossiella sp.]|nr:hypothetical protein [Urbifossiella sp.]
MSEDDWTACADPQLMLMLLRSRRAATDRKLRLFACACCRRVWGRFPHPLNRDLVEAVEDHPDGRFEDEAIHTAGVGSSSVESDFRGVPAYWVAKYLGRGFYKMTAFESAALVACKAMALDDQEYGNRVADALFWTAPRGEVAAEHVSLPAPVPDVVQVEAAAQAGLLREVFGNPFRPVVFEGEWRTEAVVGLARGMYEARDFGPAPVLADALEDAGCADADILSHCRGPGPHVRGCWVVDAVLGKA